MHERRNHSRLESSWNVGVCHQETQFQTRVTNISLGGVELYRPESWDPMINQSCELTLQMGSRQNLEIKTHVCWLSKNRVGMKFPELTGVQKRMLNRLLSTLSKEAILQESHFVM